MLKNPLYRYGDDNGRVPAHLNFGHEVYNNMVKNKDIVALTCPGTGLLSVSLSGLYHRWPSAGWWTSHTFENIMEKSQVNADTDERMTYGECAQMTADIALSLTHIGVKKGDVICICSEKRFEYLPTVLGIVCAGAAFAPLNLTYGSFLLHHRVKLVRPKVVFCSRSAFESHKAVFDEVGSTEHYILYGDDEKDGAILFKDFLTETTKLEDFQPVPVDGYVDRVFIVYSSGTTGLPKGVPVTHLGFLLNTQAITREDYKGAGVLNTREWSYSYGLMHSLGCMRVAATLVYSPIGGEKEMLEAVQKYKIKVMQLMPFIITDMIKSSILENYDVSSVECIVSSSTCVREETVNAIKQRLPNLKLVLQLYGMSEAGSICNELTAPLGSRPGSSGVPCLGFIVKVVDLDSRKPLGANQRGEICIKGPSVTTVYMDNKSTDHIDDEGFLKTGDVGYYDNDGYFYVINRIKELIKFKDHSIAPAEFEAILLQHPSVREAGVIGSPHPKHGEVPVAFVVLQPGCTATEEELVNHIDSRLSLGHHQALVGFRMQLAGGVRFIDRLPRSAGDKLDREELKQRLLN